MNAVADTSALLSLSVAEILSRTFEMIQLSIPEEVYHELLELNKYEDTEGYAAEEIINHVEKNEIILTKVQNRAKIESLLSADVQHGEAACFVLCIKKKIPCLIMDDVDAAFSLEGASRSAGISIRISAAVAVELFKKKKINLAQLKAAINKMIQLRRWEGGVLEVLAKKYLENM